MGAPRRLRLDVDRFHVSAILLDEVEPDQVEAPSCKACTPKHTTVLQVLTLVQQGFDHDKCWAVYRCKNCKREWALPYKVEHGISEVAQ